MRYVDGFLLPVPKKKLQAYRRLAQRAGKIWKEHGALEYRECVGDDMDARGMVSFPRAAKAKAGESVFFSWTVYKSKAHRNHVIKKVMKDPRFPSMIENLPFDMKRMAFGGFKVLVDLGSGTRVAKRRRGR